MIDGLRIVTVAADVHTRLINALVGFVVTARTQEVEKKGKKEKKKKEKKKKEKNRKKSDDSDSSDSGSDSDSSSEESQSESSSGSDESGNDDNNGETGDGDDDDDGGGGKQQQEEQDIYMEVFMAKEEKPIKLRKKDEKSLGFAKLTSNVMDLTENELAQGLYALAWIAHKPDLHSWFTTQEFLDTLLFCLRSSVKSLCFSTLRVCVTVFLGGDFCTQRALRTLFSLKDPTPPHRLDRTHIRSLAAMVFGVKENKRVGEGEYWDCVKYVFPSVVSVERALMYVFC